MACDQYTVGDDGLIFEHAPSKKATTTKKKSTAKKTTAGGDGFAAECYLHRSAGAYICGEETGLLEAIEGKRAWPRLKPPFPAVKGLFGRPTIVNNVETLAAVGPIVANGLDWWKAMAHTCRTSTLSRRIVCDRARDRSCPAATYSPVVDFVL